MNDEGRERVDHEVPGSDVAQQLAESRDLRLRTLGVAA